MQEAKELIYTNPVLDMNLLCKMLSMLHAFNDTPRS